MAEDNDQRIVLRLPGGVQQAIARGNVEYVTASKLSMMPEGIEKLLDRRELSDLFAFLALDRPPGDLRARPIPGSPGREQDARIQVEKRDRKLLIRTRLPGKHEWVDLFTVVTDPGLPPSVQSLRDPSGHVCLTTESRTDPIEHGGLFTLFPSLYSADFGGRARHRFARLLDLNELDDRVRCRVLAELVAPDGHSVLEEEQAISVAAPQTPQLYTIDFRLVLRAKKQNVVFGKADLCGLAIQMAGDQAGPEPTHLNAKGLHGQACDRSPAAWCTVERRFGDEFFGIALLDHPDNPNHPPSWHLDGQGLLNPSLTMLGGWTLPAGKEREYRYRIVVYQGTGRIALLAHQFEDFTAAPAAVSATGTSRK